MIVRKPYAVLGHPKKSSKSFSEEHGGRSEKLLGRSGRKVDTYNRIRIVQVQSSGIAALMKSGVWLSERTLYLISTTTRATISLQTDRARQTSMSFSLLYFLHLSQRHNRNTFALLQWYARLSAPSKDSQSIKICMIFITGIRPATGYQRLYAINSILTDHPEGSWTGKETYRGVARHLCYIQKHQTFHPTVNGLSPTQRKIHKTYHLI